METNYTFSLQTIDLSEFGFTARLYKCGEKWTVNFPQPLVSATERELYRYLCFIENVNFYLQELNS